MEYINGSISVLGKEVSIGMTLDEINSVFSEHELSYRQTTEFSARICMEDAFAGLVGEITFVIWEELLRGIRFNPTNELLFQGLEERTWFTCAARVEGAFNTMVAYFESNCSDYLDVEVADRGRDKKYTLEDGLAVAIGIEREYTGAGFYIGKPHA